MWASCGVGVGSEKTWRGVEVREGKVRGGGGGGDEGGILPISGTPTLMTLLASFQVRVGLNLLASLMAVLSVISWSQE